MRRMVGRWIIAAVALPVAAAGARALAKRLEASRGPSTVTRGLGKVGQMGRR